MFNKMLSLLWRPLREPHSGPGVLCPPLVTENWSVLHWPVVDLGIPIKEVTASPLKAATFSVVKVVGPVMMKVSKSNRNWKISYFSIQLSPQENPVLITDKSEWACTIVCSNFSGVMTEIKIIILVYFKLMLPDKCYQSKGKPHVRTQILLHY